MSHLQDGVPVAAGLDELPDDPFPGGEADDTLRLARAVLERYPVADGRCGLPGVLARSGRCDLELGGSAVDTDVPRLRAGRVGAQFWALDLPEGTGGDRALAATLELLDLARAVIAAHPEGLRPARSAGEVIDARNCGRTAVVLGPAGARALADSLPALRALHTLGLRVLTLSGTAWAGGKTGLTRFGEEVVREMNRLGVLADVSGAPESTAHRVLALSRTPVLCTRSAASALRPHPDNVSDDLLGALGAAGGLCMVPFAAEQCGTAVEDVADHLGHVRDVAGPESVGLSGAYDTGAAHPAELDNPSRHPHLVAELLRRGWSDTELSLLTWGNVQRALRSADFTARAAQDRGEPSRARLADLDGG
ncbi:dipeptidase [Streptomyces sp. J2-1]|uniref:membrane dipeptidase n=1 Tax=Streptomyces corallincola TaxID=2851888 RepID=UPI001C37EDB4|nr:membrane dipeptidase [Streptomyces corallincola]MBV2356110.1 dipeptidase [Streptomyces corallincola]